MHETASNPYAPPRAAQHRGKKAGPPLPPEQWGSVSSALSFLMVCWGADFLCDAGSWALLFVEGVGGYPSPALDSLLSMTNLGHLVLLGLLWRGARQLTRPPAPAKRPGAAAGQLRNLT